MSLAQMWPGLEIGKTCEDCDGEGCKHERDTCKLQKKKNALDEKKPTWQTVSTPVVRLVRFPFIAPEDLHHSIAPDPDFQSMAAVDDKNLPLVLRAVFHQVLPGHNPKPETLNPKLIAKLPLLQDGHRMDGWKDLNWTPRQGSLIYSGEWEW